MIQNQFSKLPKEFDFNKVSDPEINTLLSELELKTFQTKFKFGVLYAPPGKIGETEMYDNNTMSPNFEEFLNVIGEKVALKGFEGFRGGLDVKTDGNGTHSYFSKFQDTEIMFHVNTLIPYLENDPARKRYIGNDVVVVIFKESPDDVFNPAEMRSQFNHVFVVVEKVDSSYRVQISTKANVKPFPPYLPDPPLFPINESFRTYFLTKLINAERATINAARTTFNQMMDTTREALLQQITDKYKK